MIVKQVIVLIYDNLPKVLKEKYKYGHLSIWYIKSTFIRGF